jgi:hypothetical protein
VTCSATSKRTGERCRRTPRPGLNVCAIHGGSAPRAVRAARRRLLDAYLRRLLWRESLRRPGYTIGHWPQPDPETLQLASQLDRLRRRRPAWFDRIDRWWLYE